MKIVEKNGIYHLDEGRLELYTPQKYLGTVNSLDGDTANVLGFLPYKFYSKVTDKKPSKVGILNNPSIITMYPVDIFTNVEDNIWGNKYDYTNTNEYTVLHFQKGSRLMNKNIIKSLNNVTIFMDLLLGAKLDNNIPYNMLSEAWIKNMMMNGQSLGVPSTIICCIIYELCRYAKDQSKPFGQVFGKNPDMSPVAYNFVNVRQICASSSVFSAIAFEDMNSMLDASLNMTQKEKDQKISPLEKTIKY